MRHPADRGRSDRSARHAASVLRRLILGIFTIAVASGSLVAQRGVTASRPRPAAGRSRIATQFGIVAASQPLAARAGAQVLERGGNAVDAAIAANAVMGLV